MAKDSFLPLRAVSRRALWAALAVVLAAGAGVAFAIGFTGALERSLLDPGSAPTLRVQALEHIDALLGYDGFLKTYRTFLMTGDREAQAALQSLMSETDAAMTVFRQASEDGHDHAATGVIAPLLEQFRRASLYGDAAPGSPHAGNELPSLPELERAYAALKLEIAKAAEAARFARTAALSNALGLAQAISVVMLSLIAVALLALAWFVRARLVEPIETLRRSAERAADGAVFHPLWGVARGDEIGALARAADRLRHSVAAAPDAAFVSPVKEMRIAFEGQSSHLFERVMGALGEGAARLEDDLQDIASVMTLLRERIEDACRDTALAGKTAIEAATLARDGLSAVLRRLAEAAERLEHAPTQAAPAVLSQRAQALFERLEQAQAQPALPGIPEFGDREESEAARDASTIYAALGRLAGAPGDAGAVPAALLAHLARCLEALELFARARERLTDEEAAALVAALVDAIDRLNQVAGRVSETADQVKARAAG